MSVFVLKLTAMAAMLIDHIAFWLVDNNAAMRNIGRLAFFIYAFLMAESYYHLKDKPERLRNHLLKLLILCLVSEPLFDCFDHVKWIDWSSQSVMPTLTMGFLALIGSGWWSRKNAGNRTAGITGSACICLAAAMVSFFIKSDYAFCGVVLVILFYLYLSKADGLTFPWRLLALLGIEAVYILIDIWSRTGFGSWQQFIEMAVLLSVWKYGAAAAMLPLAFYNRDLGYHSRWFGWLYSIFYPLQFLVLIIVRYYRMGF